MVLLLAILLVVFVLDQPWSIVVLIVAAIIEVFEVFFLRRWAKRIDRRTKRTTGTEAMVGKTAVVVQECRPVGTVRIHGELWEARCSEGGAAPGDEVTVDRVEGLRLEVSLRGG